MGVGCGYGALGDKVVLSCVESFGLGKLDGDTLLYSVAAAAYETRASSLTPFLPFRS
jgi:hypothetical protein